MTLTTRTGLNQIDFNTIDIAGHTGYGNASRLLLDALEGQGVYDTPGSSTVLNFCMPPKYKYGDKYTIGYTPWESTEVPDDWVEGLKEVDELWSPTKWSAGILSRYREGEVKVVPHGIEPCWEPVKRSNSGIFTFLHVGEPAVRKGGEIVLEAWHKAFAKRKDVRLIYKCNKYPRCRVKDRSGSIVASPGMYTNTSVIGTILGHNEMYKLYAESDCMVYPSRGEGFGLIPFEAMATGMPTILPSQGGTADFAELSPLQIKNSIWVASKESMIHPGLWLDHSVDEVIDLMRYAVDHRDTMYDIAYNKALLLHEAYSWKQIGAQVRNLLYR